jgi:hypothetical protein
VASTYSGILFILQMLVLEAERPIFLKIAFRTTIGRLQNDLRPLLADAGAATLGG